MEIDGEGAGQKTCVGHVHTGQQLGEGRAVLVAAAQAPGQAPHLLDPLEQLGAVLADQRFAQLGA